MILAAKITLRDETVDGIPYYEAMTPAGIALSPVFETGMGGDALTYVRVPVDVGTQVLISSSTGDREGPYFILARLFDPLEMRLTNVSSLPAGAGAEYTDVNMEDLVMRVQGSSTVVSPHRVSLTSPTCGIQLRGGQLEISSSGIMENQLLNAQNTIDTLVSYIEKLNAKVAALETAVQTSAPGTIAAYEAAILAANAVSPGSGEIIRQQQLNPFNEAVSALSSSVPLPPAATVEIDLTSGVNPSIKVP